MIFEVDRSVGVATKTAETAEEADRLRQEAKVLDAARHPGLTELLALRDDRGRPVRLGLRLVAGGCLASRPGRDGVWLDDGEVAGLGVAVATTLADLHDLGIVHGAVSADHVLVDGAGQPVLCSLGRGQVSPGVAGPRPPDDVSALAAMLVSCLEPAAGARSSTLRRTLVQATNPGRRRRPTARRLAARLALVPGARLPGAPVSTPVPTAPTAAATAPTAAATAPVPGAVPDPAPGPVPTPAPSLDAPAVHGGPAPAATATPSPEVAWQPTRTGKARWVLPSAAGGLAALATAAFLLRPASRQTSPGAASRCPPVDLGCRPLPHTAGMVITNRGRYLIGAPDDPVVVGRWRCGRPVPAVLQRASGDVWAFDEWPAVGLKILGHRIGHVDGAISLTVDPGPASCDRLVVSRRNGPPVSVDPAS